MRWIFLLTLILFGSVAQAQMPEMHRIQHGKIGISIYYNDTLISVGSNKLVVLIDEQTRGIIIRLDPSTLTTGIDSLDAKLQKGYHEDVVFEGEIDLDNLWETEDAERSFEVEGDLTINGESQQVSLFGKLLESQQGMDINGLLYLHFDPLLIDFGLDELLPLFAEHACVEILQPIHIANNRN